MTEYGHRGGRGRSRRGLLRAGAGGAAALGVGGIGYAAFKLGSGKGPATSDVESGDRTASAAASPTGTDAQVQTDATFDSKNLTGPHTYERRSNPDRTIVSTAAGTQVAVLTDGTRTAT